jgi:hypothetical protein
MSRQRYKLTQDDVLIVHRWVRTKFRERQWPEDWPELTAWDTFPLEKPTTKKLQTWCDRFLDAAQWKQLHAVIRANRRDKSATRTVRLSRQASAVLHALAKRDAITLSHTIERYLTDILTPPLPTVPQVEVTPPASPTPRKKAKKTERDVRACAPEPVKNVMKVRLSLRVENNSKFVRGRKKAIDEIERSVLAHYDMQKPSKDRGEYILSIPYETDAELEKTIDDILREAAMNADDRHCFIEAEVVSVDDPERSW